jgi:2'-5' RNA ligase
VARLFAAAWPPPEVRRLLADLPRPEVEGLRWTGPAQWHVTLAFLGEADRDLALEAFLRLEAPPGARAAMGPGLAWLGRRVLVAEVAGLEEVAAAVRRGLSGPGLAPDPRPFRGHLTLARSRRPGRPPARPGELAGAGLARASWEVREVTLVESHLSRAGAAYEVVGARSLAPMPT